MIVILSFEAKHTYRTNHVYVLKSRKKERVDAFLVDVRKKLENEELGWENAEGGHYPYDLDNAISTLEKKINAHIGHDMFLSIDLVDERIGGEYLFPTDFTIELFDNDSIIML